MAPVLSFPVCAGSGGWEKILSAVFFLTWTQLLDSGNSFNLKAIQIYCYLYNNLHIKKNTVTFFVQNKKGWVFSISPECWVNGKNVNQRLSFQSWEGALDGGWALGSGTRRESLGFWLALLCNFNWLFVSRLWHLAKYTSAICIKLLIFRVNSVLSSRAPALYCECASRCFPSLALAAMALLHF